MHAQKQLTAAAKHSNYVNAEVYAVCWTYDDGYDFAHIRFFKNRQNVGTFDD